MPILKIVVAQAGHVPFVAGLPFFIVISAGLEITLLSLHFTQYPITVILLLPVGIYLSLCLVINKKIGVRLSACDCSHACNLSLSITLNCCICWYIVIFRTHEFLTIYRYCHCCDRVLFHVFFILYSQE